MVGRVISQKGLVGALVIEYIGQNEEDARDYFKIKLQNDTIVIGSWKHYYDWQADPQGVTSGGWTVGDVKPAPDWDDIPF